eukprot:gene5297-5832_t
MLAIRSILSPLRGSIWTRVRKVRLSSITQLYQEKVSSGLLENDDHQKKIIRLLDKLKSNIEIFPFHEFHIEEKVKGVVVNGKERLSSVSDVVTSKPAGQIPHPTQSAGPSAAIENDTPLQQHQHQHPRLRGIYLYGSVGAGKTMMMDLFFSSCQIDKKRRVHFHQFMLEVHRRIHAHKQSLLQQQGKSRHISLTKHEDSIAYVGREIAREAHLLCFDEFQVFDICDAVILTRLFNTIWSQGTVVFATSNRPPQELYANGLNRHDFLPFIDRLANECIVRALDSGVDYRTVKAGSSTTLQPTYYTPCNETSNVLLRQRYESDLRDWIENCPTLSSTSSVEIDVGNVTTKQSSSKVWVELTGGRGIHLLAADVAQGFCLVDFVTLCEEDRGAADYHALSQIFHSIYLQGVTYQSKVFHNQARRFITLIDELYNAHVRLIWVADAEPWKLFINEPLSSSENSQEESNSVEAPLTIDSGAVQSFQRSYEHRPVNLKVREEKNNLGQQEEISVVVGQLAAVQELDFAFQRAASRLIEMTSDDYHTQWEELQSKRRGGYC